MSATQSNVNKTSKPNLHKKANKILEDKTKQKFNKQELALIAAKIQKEQVNIAKLLLAVEQTKSYEEDGCKSMREWMQKKFTQNYDCLNRYLVAARVAYNIGGADAIGKYSNNALEAMNKLKTKEQQKLFQQIREDLGKNFSPEKLTKKVVQDKIKELGFGNNKKQQQKKSVKNALVKTLKEVGNDLSASTLADALADYVAEDVLKAAMKHLKNKLSK